MSDGRFEDIQWMHDALGKELPVVVHGYLGAPSLSGCVQRVTILNRMPTWAPGGVELEADAWHSELLAALVGQQGARVTTPITQASVEDFVQAERDSPLLEGSAVWAFKSLTMRAAYLAQDRPDLAYCVRELAKGMANPKEVHQVALKRLARYVRHRPRMV